MKSGYLPKGNAKHLWASRNKEIGAMANIFDFPEIGRLFIIESYGTFEYINTVVPNGTVMFARNVADGNLAGKMENGVVFGVVEAVMLDRGDIEVLFNSSSQIDKFEG